MDPLSLVPVHFEQLKELRNGSISYIQIIKRDQTRPPVRPVCRKLGVSKLSDIKSEGDLYNALLSVAQGQTIKAQTPPYDSLKSGLFALNTDPVPRSSRFSNDGPYSPYSPLSVGPSSAPDFDQVLECVLYIQLHWDPRDCSQSLSTFAFRFGLDESYLLTVLQRVCGILGCAHLTPHIDTTMVVDATKICFKQLELLHRSCVTDSPAISERNSPRLSQHSYSYSPHASPRQPLGDKLMMTTPRSDHHSPRYVNDDLSARMWAMSLSPSKPPVREDIDLFRGLRSTPRSNFLHTNAADEHYLPAPRPRTVTIDVKSDTYFTNETSVHREGGIFSSRISDLRTTPVQWSDRQSVPIFSTTLHSPTSADTGSDLTDRETVSQHSLPFLIGDLFAKTDGEDVNDISPRLANWLRQSPRQTSI